MNRPVATSVDGEPGAVACILAGGRGTRLRAVVSDRPKPLVEVGGRPFVTRLLDQLRAAGIARAVLCTGYMAEQMEETLGHDYRGVELRYSPEREPLGTAGALRLALEHVASSDVILALNGDSYCDVDLVAFGDDFRSSGARAALVLVEVEDAGRYGRVRVDSEGWIERFDEKSSDTGPGWINAGIYLLRRDVIAEVPAGRKVSIEREVFPRLAGQGLRGFASRGGFLDIGTPASLARAAAFFARMTV